MVKQGTNFVLRVRVGIDFDKVEQIEFVFKQRNRLKFVYPSEDAVKVPGENKVDLFWTFDDTYMFASEKPIELDTRIWLKNTDAHPVTKITSIELNRTLFRRND